MAAKLNYLSAILIAVVLISGCTNYGASPAPSSPPPAGANAVSIQNYAFSPSTLTVSAGTTITWTNQDSVSHTITSDSGAFDSGSIASGNTNSYTINTPGTYSYHCSIHPSMKASIIVQ
jgi:plastocyanin